MKYLFNGDYDRLEYIIEEKLDEYSNIEFHDAPVIIEENIKDVIKDGSWYRVEQFETITINGREMTLKEMIPVVANHADYHVIGVSVGDLREDVHYYVVPCNWSPRWGTANMRTVTDEEET